LRPTGGGGSCCGWTPSVGCDDVDDLDSAIDDMLTVAKTRFRRRLDRYKDLVAPASSMPCWST